MPLRALCCKLVPQTKQRQSREPLLHDGRAFTEQPHDRGEQLAGRFDAHAVAQFDRPLFPLVVKHRAQRARMAVQQTAELPEHAGLFPVRRYADENPLLAEAVRRDAEAWGGTEAGKGASARRAAASSGRFGRRPAMARQPSPAHVQMRPRKRRVRRVRSGPR